ncbi:N-acetylmuramoyl-L-alanine amidase [uncultured Chloroflexus sp.]|uniref:N-acetylmuramoyl-L-alanine amidase n=1 Tax=uncultured Chloroflexus sp. TaxID=214040 RepID=UPI002633B2AC|nr:N-acetylmuramoyl-L-alanine amidase [uncultured Chloroflexus sp.]
MRLIACLILLHFFILAACAPAPAATPTGIATREVVSAPTTTPLPLPSPTLPPVPTVTPARAAQAVPPPVSDTVAEAAPPAPTAIPSTPSTPTPRPTGTPLRVGIQIGHLRSHELPDEQAHLRTSTGARWNGITEAQVNEAIAVRVRDILVVAGVEVDLLPATIPPAYDADAFVAIHADGSAEGARGWKIATPWRASAASRALLAAVAATYGVVTGLPEDRNGITVNMRGYYAFNYRRHTHAIARTTPAIIIETGFLTNAADREIIVARPEVAARGIAEGILQYLNQRDPNDGAALLPPEWPILYTSAETMVRAGPADTAKLVARVPADSRIFVFNQAGEWYEAMVRAGNARYVGWVRVDQTRPATANDNPAPPPAEPPATNP